MSAFDGVTTPSLAIQFLKSGTWTSTTITDVLQIDIRRGRTRQSERDQAGISVVVFNNTSGYYDPDNTSAGNPWVVSGKKNTAPSGMNLSNTILQASCARPAGSFSGSKDGT